MKFEIDFRSLKRNYDRKIIRKFNDVRDYYKNPKGIKNDPLVYIVYVRDYGVFETGLTVIESGAVNKEFFMTKGHKHKKPRNEIYILLGGKGKLLIQDEKLKILSLKKNKIYVVPGKKGHRLINIGNKKLEVLTIYSKDSGHDYNFKFKKRLFKK